MTTTESVPEFFSGYMPLGEDFGQLETHRDARGDLTELYRREWPGAPILRQWNLVHDGANVVRGMHVHPLHSDYIIVIQGEMLLGLRDIRRDSPSYGKAGIVRLLGDRLNWVLIRPGVVHGFYIPEGNVMVYGLTHEWDMDDEIGCRWNDPMLGLQWPAISNPCLSERDTSAGSFEQLVQAYEKVQTHAQ